MTLKELEEYSVIANQIQSFRNEYIPSFIKGVNTTKGNVQSFDIADSTADTAFEMLEINQFYKIEIFLAVSTNCDFYIITNLPV